MMKLANIEGATYTLAQQPIGSGGEGDIYPVLGSGGKVAKIYKPKAMSKELEEKLRVMISHPPNSSVLSQVAWPLDMLYDGGTCKGFVMPKLSINAELGDIYTYPSTLPISIEQKINIAKNICVVISEVHRAGYVFGDFNPCNIGLDTDTGVVSFLDTDTYHVVCPVSGKTFRCNVCAPGYAAPELLERCSGYVAENPSASKDAYAKTNLPTFTSETDSFALAVHIFKLLMNGYTPFGGIIETVSVSQGSPGVGDTAVRRDSYCFKPGYRHQSAAILPLDALPQEVADLFTRAFIIGKHDPKQRPSAEEWHEALTLFEQTLVDCRNNPLHQYDRKNRVCPMCEADRRYHEAVYGESSHNEYEESRSRGTLVQTPYKTSTKRSSKIGILTASVILFVFALGIGAHFLLPDGLLGIFRTDTESVASMVTETENGYNPPPSNTDLDANGFEQELYEIILLIAGSENLVTLLNRLMDSIRIADNASSDFFRIEMLEYLNRRGVEFGLSAFNVTDANGYVLLRTDAPDLYGDSLLAVPAIAQGLNRGVVSTGISNEIPFAAAPILRDGEIIGTITAFADSDNPITIPPSSLANIDFSELILNYGEFIEVIEIYEGMLLTLQDIFANLFVSGQAEFQHGMNELLDAIASALMSADISGYYIAVVAHTDNSPIMTDRFPNNRHLSYARAAAIKEYLVMQWGISPQRIEAHGIGEFWPVDTNETAEGRARNRRVEIRIHFSSASGILPTTHTVESGETLAGIARRYFGNHGAWEHIAQINDISNGNITAGQVLIITPMDRPAPIVPPVSPPVATGDVIRFGDYYWRVLYTTSENTALLLSEYVIESRAFHYTPEAVSWEYSSLRAYLNGDFYRSFSQSDRNRIVERESLNLRNPWFGGNDGNETNDKIFLLSLEEVARFFGDSGQLASRPGQDSRLISDEFNRQRQATELNVNHLGGRWLTAWWLRSPGGFNRAAIVSSDGVINVHGDVTNAHDAAGVRPALVLDISSYAGDLPEERTQLTRTFYPNRGTWDDGSNEPWVSTVWINANEEIPILPSPPGISRFGYEFIGWDPTGQTFTAVWQRIPSGFPDFRERHLLDVVIRTIRGDFGEYFEQAFVELEGVIGWRNLRWLENTLNKLYEVRPFDANNPISEEEIREVFERILPDLVSTGQVW